MATAFYSQTKFTIFIHLFNYFLLLLQPLFALIPRELSEWAQCHSRDEKALSSSNSMVQSKIKVYKMLSQPRDIWKIVLCFDGFILSFSVTTQITAANKTIDLSSIPLKERIERYIYGPWEWLTSFSATA